MNVFVSMRHFLQNNSEIILSYNQRPQRIFFQGQIFDTYAKFESILASAENEIILIDNYVDLSILQRLAKKKPAPAKVRSAPQLLDTLTRLILRTDF